MNKLLRHLPKALKLAVAAGALIAGQAHALALLGQEPDPSVIVVRNGLEWVYAAPCAGENPSCGVVQLHHDFEFATDDQWLASFSSIADLVSAFSGTNGTLCAATYFSTAHNHCDIGDAAAGYIWHSPLAPDGTHRNHMAAETFLVRDTNGVPEPASLALAAVGLLAAAGAARRRRASDR